MPLQSYPELRVWRAAFDLAVDSHRLAGRPPPTERYALGAQIRRASASVPARIAEGYWRSQRGDYLRHLSIAAGSLKELETHLPLARALDYIDSTTTDPLLRGAASVGRMLTRLQRSLRAQ